MLTSRGKQRLQEIIKIASILKWIEPARGGYPLMQLSEVEKCMLAMIDDFELERMRDWLKDTQSGKLIEINGQWQPANWPKQEVENADQ